MGGRPDWLAVDRRGRQAFFLLLSTAFMCGCDSRPGRVYAPSISADDAAAEAIQTADTDGDGLLSEQELNSIGSLRSSMASIDSNGDRKISAEEIAERIQYWQKSRIAIAPGKCLVTLNGRPLAGAEVRLEPESFLGDQFFPAFGVTGSDGIAPVSIAEEHRPRPQITGIQLGFYRVAISRKQNGVETIPDKYNQNSILGTEIAPGDMGTYGFQLVE
jgi:hypothetical protein